MYLRWSSKQIQDLQTVTAPTFQKKKMKSYLVYMNNFSFQKGSAQIQSPSFDY